MAAKDYVIGRLGPEASSADTTAKTVVPMRSHGHSAPHHSEALACGKAPFKKGKSSSSSRKTLVQCTYCKKGGHSFENCFKRLRDTVCCPLPPRMTSMTSWPSSPTTTSIDDFPFKIPRWSATFGPGGGRRLCQRDSVFWFDPRGQRVEEYAPPPRDSRTLSTVDEGEARRGPFQKRRIGDEERNTTSPALAIVYYLGSLAQPPAANAGTRE